MDLRSKVLLGLVLFTVAAVSAWKYDAFMVKQDFMVFDQISCDPSSESCFMYSCEEGDEECDDTIFKKIEKNAENITLCPNYIEGSCPELSCGEGEKECKITYCSENTLKDGEECVETETATVLEEESNEEDPLVEDEQ